MTRDDILKILNENIGYERNSSGTNLFGVDDAADCIIEKFDKYPYEKVREFLAFVIDKVFIGEYDIATILPADDVLAKAKELIEEINTAELPD